jgi:prevent-host-death family protein
MRSMPAGEFKARCLRVMEEVKKYRTPVVITKKGRPVAKLMPPDEPAKDVFGCMAGTARIAGDVVSPVVPPEAWNEVRSAMRAERRRKTAGRRRERRR